MYTVVMDEYIKGGNKNPFYSDISTSLKSEIGSSKSKGIAFSIVTDILRDKGFRIWS